MIRRIAGIGALLVVAVAVMAGLEADNSFTTTIMRALTAMAGTFVVGLVVGAMAQKMMDENKKSLEEKSKIAEPKPANDR
jgi:putative effector of murein hydrolase LrgA (UPF0299 family)